MGDEIFERMISEWKQCCVVDVKDLVEFRDCHFLIFMCVCVVTRKEMTARK